jgi:hypothetical protein
VLIRGTAPGPTGVPGISDKYIHIGGVSTNMVHEPLVLKGYKESKISIPLPMLLSSLIRCSRVPGISGLVGATGPS